MKNNFIIYIFFITAALVTTISVNSQEQKKPSERSFTKEISKIKQIQTERNRLIEQSKTQTSENATLPASGSVPANTENKASSSQATKPSSGEMRKPKKPVPSKG